MQRITLLCVGRIKTPWIAEGCAEYEKRLRGHAKFSVVELPASKERDPEKQKRNECERIMNVIEKLDADVWLLDEKGERMASHEFAFFLTQARDSGRHIVFVLGGAYGLDPAMRRAPSVRGTMRLSDMTFPHELCRVVFLEQLYRGCEIGKGSGYHH